MLRGLIQSNPHDEWNSIAGVDAALAKFETSDPEEQTREACKVCCAMHVCTKHKHEMTFPVLLQTSFKTFQTCKRVCIMTNKTDM